MSTQSKRQMWLTDEDRDLLRTALDVWLNRMAASEVGTGVAYSTKAAHSFVRRRICEMHARLADASEQP